VASRDREEVKRHGKSRREREREVVGATVDEERKEEEAPRVEQYTVTDAGGETV